MQRVSTRCPHWVHLVTLLVNGIVSVGSCHPPGVRSMLAGHHPANHFTAASAAFPAHNGQQPVPFRCNTRVPILARRGRSRPRRYSISLTSRDNVCWPILTSLANARLRCTVWVLPAARERIGAGGLHIHSQAGPHKDAGYELPYNNGAFFVCARCWLMQLLLPLGVLQQCCTTYSEFCVCIRMYICMCVPSSVLHVLCHVFAHFGVCK